MCTASGHELIFRENGPHTPWTRSRNHPMKNLFIIIGALVWVLAGCEQDTEFPLILPPTAEPSSKMCNDRGIDHYR